MELRYLDPAERVVEGLAVVLAASGFLVLAPYGQAFLTGGAIAVVILVALVGLRSPQVHMQRIIFPIMLQTIVYLFVLAMTGRLWIWATAVTFAVSVVLFLASWQLRPWERPLRQNAASLALADIMMLAIGGLRPYAVVIFVALVVGLIVAPALRILQ